MFEDLIELYNKPKKKKIEKVSKPKPLRNEFTKEKIYLSESGSVLPNKFARWN